MPPNTLAEAVESIQAGAPQDVILAEFVDTFDLATTGELRYASIEREPKLTGDARLDALVGAIAEYLAKQRRLGHVPGWVCDPARRLKTPWFTSAAASDAMREFPPSAAPPSSRRAISSPRNGRYGARAVLTLRPHRAP